MCNFFSVVSDGKGTVLFFTPEDVVQIMASGNKENYDFNSHTSLCHFKGIKAKNEHQWNKWEYTPEKEVLVEDSIQTTNDKDAVFSELKKWFAEKDVVYLRNLYGHNAGSYNAGSRNAGSYNAGSDNAGSYNAGSDNAGSYNAGSYNAGSDNAGSYNAGSYNAGSYNAGSDNAGSYNAGSYNAGSDNAGSYNAGSYNAGSYNAGSRNAGYSNAGSDNAGSFCTTSDLRLFNKPCTKEEHDKVKELDWSWFSAVRWVPFKDMTKAEKETYPEISETVCGGYYQPVPFKEAWEKCPKSFIQGVKKLKNFDAKVFEQITGLKVKP